MKRSPLADGWFVRRKTNTFAEQHVGLGDDWTAVTLPHDAMIGTPRAPEATPANAYFHGGVWEYRRPLEVPADAAGDVMMLRFEGVYRDAVVTVNGSIAGQRPYGYSAFAVPIDHLVRPGEQNEIKVEARAHADSRWYSGAGIHRPVWLLRAGRVHLLPDELFVDASDVDDEQVGVLVSVAVRNAGPTSHVAMLRIALLDAAGTLVASDEAPVTTFPGDTASVRRRIHLSTARRWSVDDPYLYRCEVTLLDGDREVDAEDTSFGVRSLSVDPVRGLRVNGESVLLRGACVHHDNGPIGSVAIDRAEERRVELLKEAGFNAIRSAHNPMSQAMLDACDRIGMLVMDEAFDMWNQSKSDHDYADRFAEWWEADIEALVRGSRNHPSVIFYSIGNEIPDGSTPTGLRVGRALAEKVRSLDGSRLVTQAVSGLLAAGPAAFAAFRQAAQDAEADREAGINSVLTGLADLMGRVMQTPLVGERTVEAFAPLDVAGYNYMDARFDQDRAAYPNRVIVSSESYPPSIDSEWAGVVRNPQVIGEFTWTGWDYLGEVGVGRVEYGEAGSSVGMTAFHGEYPWLTAWCGDIDITGVRRPQSYYREIVFGLRTDPYIAVQPPQRHGLDVAHASPWAFRDVVSSWTWPGHEGSPVTVDVYGDADEVELVVDGRSVGRLPAGPEHRFRAAFEATYRPGTIEAIAWRDGVESGRTQLRTATGRVMLSACADRDEIGADPTDLAFVAVTLVDDEGNVWTGADRPVHVSVDGPAVLQGLASADPRSKEPFTGSTCTTFEGRALAVVRPTGAGAITVSVAADECEQTAVAEIRAS